MSGKVATTKPKTAARVNREKKNASLIFVGSSFDLLDENNRKKIFTHSPINFRCVFEVLLQNYYQGH